MPEPTFAPPDAEAPPFVLPPAPTAETPSRLSSVAVHRFRILGVTRFTPEQIESVTAGFVDRPLNAEDLEELRYRLTRLYLDAGYLNSGARLEGVDPETGVVTYQIIEGRLGEIQVTGAGDLAAYLGERVALGAGVPFNTHRLQERIDQLLGDPLIARLDGAISPGERVGEAILDLDVELARPWSLRLGLDNHKTVGTGEFQGTLDGALRNLTGRGDRLDLGLRESQGYRQGRLGFELPLNGRDSRLLFGLEGSRSRVTEPPLDSLDIEAEAFRGELGLSHPLIDRLRESLRIGARIALEEGRNELGGEPFSFSRGEEDGESRVATLELSQEYTRRYSDRAWALQSELTFGLDALDATIHPDDRPDGRFVAWLGRFQVAQRTGTAGGQLLLRGDLRLASEALLPLSRFAVGGVYSVRGYRENILVGDRGYSLSLEYRQPLPASWLDPMPGKLVALTFADIGAAWDAGASAPKPLTSLGLGLRWSPANQLKLELSWAHPFNEARQVEGDAWQDEGVHLRLDWEI
jgi:hemolysin activation/secretion protein